MDTSARRPDESGFDVDGRHDALYTVRPPWEIGGPQPALAAPIESGLVRGRVLDAGCGTGEHALMAAAHGCEVVGVDLSQAALVMARAKADERGLEARFVQQDLLELDGMGERFDVVLDSLVLHGFHDDQRARYVEAVTSVLVRPGGRMFVLCYAEEPPGRGGRVHRLTQAQLAAAFDVGWRIDSIDAVTVATALDSLPHGLRGWRASLTRI